MFLTGHRPAAFYPREHAMLARVYILLFVVVVVGVGVVVDALLNYCEFRHGCTSRRVVYCEFRHGCKSGSCVSVPFTLHKFASICVASIFASICVNATQIGAN
jgi:hypothetical protein